MNTVTIEHDGQTYELLAGGGIRLIRDLELARILAFGRLRDVRYLIKSHSPSLGEVSRYRSAKPGRAATVRFCPAGVVRELGHGG